MVDEITFEDFAKLDLRVATIKEVEEIEGADKLWKLTIDVGDLGERVICAGIKEHYDKDLYFQKNQLLIKLWFWIGPTAHIFVLIIAAVLFRPGIYFIFTIGIANIYMVILWIVQVRVKNKLLY